MDGQGDQGPDSRPELRFGRILQEARKKAGFTLRELAAHPDFHWAYNTISEYENGRSLATAEFVAAFERCLGLPQGSLEKERLAARDQRRELGDAPRERSRRAPDHADSTRASGPERELGADGGPRRARRTRRAAALAACGCVGALALVALLHDGGSPPRPVGQADATRLVEQYIARFRAEDLGGVTATLAPNPRIIDRTQTASMDKTTTTVGREDVRGEYRATFGIADLSDRRERVVATRVGTAATIVDTEWTDSLDRRNVGPRSQGTTSYEVVSVEGEPRIATVRERSLVAFSFGP